MQTGDRLICVLLKPLAVGYTFKNWPLHVTILPWSRTEVSSEELTDELRYIFADIRPFTMHVAGEAGFGYKGRKLVNLIAKPSLLDALESRARKVLHGHKAWIVDEANGFKRQFRPHITENKSGRAHAGESYACDALYIVEQKGEHKEVTGKIIV